MKKISVLCLILSLIVIFCGCSQNKKAQILATTKPVYNFTAALCEGTGLQVALLVSENVSCLHDYTLQVSQMRKLESAELIVINGAGFEDFLADALPINAKLLDSSANIELHCGTHHHEEADHSHQTDPHIWLSISNAKMMAENIYEGLFEKYPKHREQFAANRQKLQAQFAELEALSQDVNPFTCRDLVTFHDGFSYLAESLDLHILRAIEEESGSEASAGELISIIKDVNAYSLPAIFTEVSGATSAAAIIRAETGAKVYELDMGLSERGYFEAMRYNIITLKEALG